MKWQPIETAPKDVSVLVFIPHAEHYGEGIYRAILSSEFGSWTTFGLHVGRAVGAGCWPTHWMPLPDAPEALESECRKAMEATSHLDSPTAISLREHPFEVGQ